jgi:hypothetical protein
MIDGWIESVGCEAEIAMFNAMGKPVAYSTMEGLRMLYGAKTGLKSVDTGAET